MVEIRTRVPHRDALAAAEDVLQTLQPANLRRPFPRNPLPFAASFLSDAHRRDNLDTARLFGQPIELAPACTAEAPPPVALPDEFDRVLRTHPESNFELERHRLSTGPHHHSATVAHVIRDALLFRGALVRVGEHYAGPRGQRLRSLQSLPVPLGRAMLCSNTVIARYFGHWMHDGLPLEMLAEQCGLPAITSGAGEWPHGPGYRALAGTRPRPLEAARIDELWVVDDRGLNAGRIARLQSLRERVRDLVGPAEEAPRAVFLMRGNTGTVRELANEAEVEAALAARGFVTLHPERSTVDQIVRALAHAELVVAIEGSAQSHYLMSAPRGGRILSIQPPMQFNAIFRTFFEAIGIRWGYVVAEPTGDAAFTLPVARLLQSLDLLAKA